MCAASGMQDQEKHLVGQGSISPSVCARGGTGEGRWRDGGAGRGGQKCTAWVRGSCCSRQRAALEGEGEGQAGGRAGLGKAGGPGRSGPSGCLAWRGRSQKEPEGARRNPGGGGGRPAHAAVPGQERQRAWCSAGRSGSESPTQAPAATRPPGRAQAPVQTLRPSCAAPAGGAARLGTPASGGSRYERYPRRAAHRRLLRPPMGAGMPESASMRPPQ
ncbi:hypothetical protein BDZ91DRAFT_830233 [Kalaharituber pfeilii]|nr:hypothetical protein BDZ91DRAFT_830233 [Kalaharituber pfeilii]